MNVQAIKRPEDEGFLAYFVRFNPKAEMGKTSKLAVYLAEDTVLEAIYVDKDAVANKRLLWSTRGAGYIKSKNTEIRPETAFRKLKNAFDYPNPWLVIMHHDPAKLAALAARFWQPSVIAKIQTLIPLNPNERKSTMRMNDLQFDGLSQPEFAKAFDPFDL